VEPLHDLPSVGVLALLLELILAKTRMTGVQECLDDLVLGLA
jgi:hypothetical protein